MDQIKEFVSRALAEDVGRGDLFSKCMEPRPATAVIKSKAEGIFAGVPYARALAHLQGIDAVFEKEDGDPIGYGDILVRLSGSGTALLETERTLLNLLQHASGIATKTRKVADLLEGSGIKLLDTRKTRPLLRSFEKYATTVGGAVNHRMGLDDCLMLKDTHLKVVGDLAAFIAHARKKIPFTTRLEVECEDLETAKAAMDGGAGIIMCDNMDRETIRQVADYRKNHNPQCLLEASGNIDETTVDRYIGTGIDALSSGSIVHQATWLDFSMRMQ